MDTPKILIELYEYEYLIKLKDELKKIEDSDTFESILCRKSGFCGIKYPVVKALTSNEANDLLHKEIKDLNKTIAELEGQLRRLAEEEPKWWEVWK